MLSKLSENGVAGFILANGALSAPGAEKAIRKQLIERDVVEAIFVLPMDMFYTTDISVSLWVLNKNKSSRSVVRGQEKVEFRDRSHEVLFFDARGYGTTFEKKYIEFNLEEDISSIVSVFHAWRRSDHSLVYRDQEELCYSAQTSEIVEKDFSLVPSSYIRFAQDIGFQEREHDLERTKTEVRRMLNDDSNLNEQLMALLDNGEDNNAN